MKGINYSQEEVRLQKIGQNAYNNALEYYFFPSLPEPKMIFDYTKKKGFFIDFNSYQISLNLANTPNIHLDKEIFDYFYSLSLHEIAHYVYCPYDNLTNFRLLGAAINGKINKYYAPMVVNIFTDLIIDYRTHQTFPELMEWELKISIDDIYKKQDMSKSSKLWKILVRCYEIIWNANIFPKDIDTKEIDSLAKKICKIILKNYNDESVWEKKVKKIARLLKELLKNQCSLNSFSDMGKKSESKEGKEKKEKNKKNNQNNQNNQKPGSENPFFIPEDVVETFGDLREIKRLDIMKSGDTDKKKSKGPNNNEIIQETFETLGSEMNYRTFRDILALNGFTNSIENMSIWYRGQAKNLLKIEYFEKKPGDSIPTYPTPWRIGDPIEELDAVQTLLTSPVIIPNITTRKWIREEGPGNLISKKLPDLMIVIDSSGSMDWTFLKTKVKGRYHIALLSAMAALHYSIQKGSHVSAINFSERIKFQSWTNDAQKIEKILLNYQGYGTILPANQILKLAEKADRKSLILIISDLEVYNWKPTKSVFRKLLAMGHKIISFFIDGDEEILVSDDFQNLISEGAKFYCIDKIDDLIGLVISEVKNNYNLKDNTKNN